jgi:phenylpyruvate tautomerase PptA (4-oxalocrotonate tautomerase family)
MPITQVSILQGKSETYRRTVADSVCDALHQAFGVPEDDRFVTILEHQPADFVYAPLSMGIARTADVLIFRVTANRGRSIDQKKAFYSRLTSLLKERLGVLPDDVFISLVEVDKENWSFGSGIAQLA